MSYYLWRYLLKINLISMRGAYRMRLISNKSRISSSDLADERGLQWVLVSQIFLRNDPEKMTALNRWVLLLRKLACDSTARSIYWCRGPLRSISKTFDSLSGKHTYRVAGWFEYRGKSVKKLRNVWSHFHESASRKRSKTIKNELYASETVTNKFLISNLDFFT